MSPRRLALISVLLAALAAALQGRTQPVVASAAQRLGDAIRRLDAGDAAAARAALEAVVADARRDGDLPTEGHALGQLARALQVLGDAAGAAARFADAEAVLTDAGDPYPLGLLLDARAQFEYGRRDALAAEQGWRRAQDLFERAGRPRDQARVLYSLSFVRRQDSVEVASLLDRALSLARASNSRDVEGQILQRWGDEHVLQGDYGAALEKTQAAVGVLEAAARPQLLARAYTSLGRVYRLHGSYDAALAAFERALELHRTTNDVAGIGQSMNAVAVALRVLGRTADAIAAGQDATGFLEQRSDRSGTLALALHTLATALEDGGRTDEALAAVDRGLAARPLPADRPLLLATRASLLSTAGRHEDAVAALAEAESLPTTRQDIRSVLLGTKADLQAQAGRIDEALETSATLLRLQEDQRTKAAPVDGLKAGFDNVRQWAWSQRVRLLDDAGRHGEALAATEGARSRALADLLAARRLDAVGLPPHEHAGDTGAGPRATGVATPPLLRGRSSELQVASPVTTAPPHLSEIAAHAARLGSTVLAYWVERHHVRVWAVDGDAHVRHAVVHADARRVGALVRASWSQHGARATVTGASREGGGTAGGGDATRALRELHELLIAPVAQALPRVRASRLTIVPHGPLFRLSFGALRSPSGRYLLEDYEIHYTPSLAVLAATQAMTNRAAPSGALVVAAPSLQEQLVAEGLGPLPGAKAEGRAVAALSAARAPELLIGTLATESSVRRLAGERRLLHFATHAVVSDDHPLDSFLALAPEAGRSGHDADGRLTAEEVYDLRLDADLVVLSACRTAGGRVTGDGIGGLVRAFVYAGTPSIVATLSELPDAAGAFALPRFYSTWARGHSKAAALRSAQLALLRALRAGRIVVDTPAGRFALPELPAFWAGLVMIGEP
jgi:CHAT domain-containing protein/tetratricopeptide (TPR) repeat protein